MDESLSALEAMPHICKKVCMMWPSHELNVYLASLLMDSRGGTRAGFPKAVETDLLCLLETNKWRRALDYQERLGMGIPEAYEKVQAEDYVPSNRDEDLWIDPMTGGAKSGRRYTDKAPSVRPHRRREEDSFFGMILAALSDKLVLLLIAALIATVVMWPSTK